MMKFPLFFCLFIFHLPVLSAQYTEMIGKPYPERLDAIHRLNRNVIQKQIDSIALMDTLENMRSLGKNPEYRDLALEADLLEAYRDFRLWGRIEGVKRVMTESGKMGISHIEGRAIGIIANDHWYSRRYEKAFRWYLRLDSMLQTVDVADFPNKARYLAQIGFAHYHFGDYKQAIRYFEKVADFPTHDYYVDAWRHAVNNMGLAYQKLDQLRRSDSCFLILSEETENNSEQWNGIAAGNLGYNHYLRKDYKEAIPLFEKDIRIAEKYKDYGLAAGSMIPLADVLIHQEDLSEARFLLDKAFDYIDRSKQTDRLRLLYPVLSRWYMAANQPAEGARYLDSALSAAKNYHEKFNALQLHRAKLEATISQKETILQQERAEHEKRKRRRSVVFSLLVVVGLCGLFIVYRQRKTAELRLRNHDLMLLKAERELQDAHLHLDSMAREASEKEEQILRLQRKKKSEVNRELIDQLTRQMVITAVGWEEFSKLFNKVYPDFLFNIKSRYPKLTPAEIRCLAMQKLRFSNKEMAALQGITPNAVMVTKHRIRKKLEMPTQQDLEEFISTFS